MGYRKRRTTLVTFAACLVSAVLLYISVQQSQPTPDNNSTVKQAEVAQQPAVASANPSGPAADALGKLAVKGRAPKTGYSRKQFGDGWADTGNCDMRQRILARDMTDVQLVSETDCRVRSGTLNDPYTGRQILFVSGPGTSSAVQIDHIVAISNAWQTGAQQLTAAQREQLANDPLELIAADGPANNEKSDGDAATWLPSNKDYRCRYIARQIAVKTKYSLWVTPAEHDAMARVLNTCPEQALPVTM